MDTDRLRDLATRLHATPSDLLGLMALLVGAATVAVALVAGVPGGRVPVATSGTEAALPTGTVVVHVSGAVRVPGVVTLADGARVADALAAAGGATDVADLGGLNLARVLVDGEQVRVTDTVVGVDGERIPTGAAEERGARDADGRLDLNRASRAELEELPGIGPVLADRIVAWREREGPFREIGGLREVPGIGERTFQTLAPSLVVP